MDWLESIWEWYWGVLNKPLSSLSILQILGLIATIYAIAAACILLHEDSKKNLKH